MKRKVVILGIIENKQGKILMTQRNDPDIAEAHMKWDIVGGTKKSNESFEQTLKRECLEETGCRVKLIEKINTNVSRIWKHKDYTLKVSLFCYHCRLVSQKRNIKDKRIISICWVLKENVLELNLLPTTRTFLEYHLNKR